MRIKDYPQTNKLESTDSFVIDGDKGTGRIETEDLKDELGITELEKKWDSAGNKFAISSPWRLELSFNDTMMLCFTVRNTETGEFYLFAVSTQTAGISLWHKPAEGTSSQVWRMQP